MFLSAFTPTELITLAEALHEPLKAYCAEVMSEPRAMVEQFLALSDEALEQLQPMIPAAILSLITAKIPAEENTLTNIFSAIPESVIYLDLSDNALNKADTFALKQAFQSLHRGLRIIELSGNGLYQLPDSVRREILATLPSDAELIINDDVELQHEAERAFLDDVTLTGSSLSSPSTPPPISPTQAQQSFFPNATAPTERENYLGTSPTAALSNGIQ